METTHSDSRRTVTVPALLAAQVPLLVGFGLVLGLSPVITVVATVLVVGTLAGVLRWVLADARDRSAKDRLEQAKVSHLDAVEAERLRSADMLTQLARRNQGLLARQMAQLVRLPADRQRSVTEVVTLTQRMRRNAESLLVLAGEDAKRLWTQPASLESVLDATADALGRTRIQLTISHPGTVNGGLVRDLTHLVTELVDNALTWTPDGATISVRAGMAADGRWLVMVDDNGPGLSPDQLVLANERLHKDSDVRYADVEQLGLQVVSRLSRRHKLDVSLVARAEGSLTAVVWIPAEAIAAPTGALISA